MEPLVLSEFSQKGEHIFQTQILPSLPVENLKGKIIAIDVETGDYGDYYVESTVLKAGMLGRKTHPQAKFYFKRIGYDAVYRQHGIVKKRSQAR